MSTAGRIVVVGIGWALSLAFAIVVLIGVHRVVSSMPDRFASPLRVRPPLRHRSPG